MLPTSHALVGYLLHQKSKSKKSKWLTIGGAVLPDIAMITSFSILFLKTIFSGKELSYSIIHEGLHQEFLGMLISNILHSGVFWIIIMLIAYFFSKSLLALSIGGMSHVIIDLLTHQTYSWNHLYPFPVQPINGIVNYFTLSFFIAIHIVWAIIFIPRIIKYYKKLK